MASGIVVPLEHIINPKSILLVSHLPFLTYVYHTVNRYRLPGLSRSIDHIINQVKTQGHRTLLSLKNNRLSPIVILMRITWGETQLIYPKFTQLIGRLNLVGAPLSWGPLKVVISLQKWMPPKAMEVSCDNHRVGWLLFLKLCTLFLPYPYFWLLVGKYWLIPLVGTFLFFTCACHNFYMDCSVFLVPGLHHSSSGCI